MTSPEIVVKIDRADANSSSVASSNAGSNRHVRESSFDFDSGSSFSSTARGRGLSSPNGSADFSFDAATGSMGSSSPNINLATEDPPSRLISQFLEQQRAAGQMVLDMDMEMDELRKDTRRSAGLPPLPPDSLHGKQNPSRGPSPLPSPGRASSGFTDGMSREMLRVSFKTDAPHRRSTDYNDLGELSSSSDSDRGGGEHVDGDGLAEDERRTGGLHSRRFQSYRDNAEVVRCTSNAAYDRIPTLMRNKTTRSRLMDPPSEPKSAGFSTRSGQLRSGLLGKGAETEDEEYDPFFDEDLPDEYKKEKNGCCAVMEWISLVLIIGALFCSLFIPTLRNKKLWRLKLWKWDVMVLVLICGRLVSGWGIRFIVFFIERNFMLRKRVLYFVYGLRNAVRNCIWLGLALLTWHLLFDQRVEDEENVEFINYVTKILVCFLVGAVVWLIKTLMVKVLASSFHVNAYFDRIQETLFNQFVIEKLSGPPSFELHRRDDDEMSISDLQRFPNVGSMFPSAELKSNLHSPGAKSDRSMSGKIYLMSGNLRRSNSIGYSMRASGPLNKKDKRGITIDHLHKLNQKNVSAWNMKRLMNVVRRGALTTLDEHMVNSTYEDDSAKEIRSEVEAKAAARKIFRNVARPPARFIYFEDLLRFMQEDDAIKTLGLFEGALESERISKSSLKNWVVNAFRGRRALTLTITDTKSAVNKLHKIVNGLVSVIILIIWLIMLNIATSKFLVFASSQVLLVAFIFGNFCKNVFESIIFLFVIHPYDVGDRCEIDTVQMVVEEMNILTTVFLRFDNQKIIFPNYMLLTKPIGNFYRSPDMGDAVEFCFHILTPPEKISLARQRILSYIENKKEHWHPNPMIILKDMESFYTLKIAIWLQHKMNHQDMGERWGRRALLVEECVKVFRELDVEYRVLPLNVNVRNMPPLNFGPPNMNTGSAEGSNRDMFHR